MIHVLNDRLIDSKKVNAWAVHLNARDGSLPPTPRLPYTLNPPPPAMFSEQLAHRPATE